MSGEEEREYIGLTENAFKQRYANHNEHIQTREEEKKRRKVFEKQYTELAKCNTSCYRGIKSNLLSGP